MSTSSAQLHSPALTCSWALRKCQQITCRLRPNTCHPQSFKIRHILTEALWTVDKYRNKQEVTVRSHPYFKQLHKPAQWPNTQRRRWWMKQWSNMCDLIFIFRSQTGLRSAACWESVLTWWWGGAAGGHIQILIFLYPGWRDAVCQRSAVIFWLQLWGQTPLIWENWIWVATTYRTQEWRSCVVFYRVQPVDWRLWGQTSCFNVKGSVCRI